MYPEKLQNMIDEFNEFNSVDEKFELLLDYAEQFKPMDSSLKTQDKKIIGCTSEVFIHAEIKNGYVFFSGDADSLLVKGLLFVLFDSLNGSTSEIICGLDSSFLSVFGLNDSLTQSRVNASLNILNKMKSLIGCVESRLCYK